MQRQVVGSVVPGPKLCTPMFQGQVVRVHMCWAAIVFNLFGHANASISKGGIKIHESKKSVSIRLMSCRELSLSWRSYVAVPVSDQ